MKGEKGTEGAAIQTAFIPGTLSGFNVFTHFTGYKREREREREREKERERERERDARGDNSRMNTRGRPSHKRYTQRDEC